MRTFRTEGIILKRRNFGEADRILTIFTKDHGKLQVKAAGVRKITSRRSSHVEVLNHGVFSLYKGNAWPILTEAQTVDNFSIIKTDLQRMGSAYHMCELIDGLCPENQETRRVFFLLKNMLGLLSQELVELENRTSEFLLAMHEFEIDLLITLGYWDKTNALSQNFDTDDFIESILERKLKSKNIFSKLQ
jgi:DNA repair protein RecO (recombination protein O)